MFTDITRRRESEEALKEAKAQASYTWTSWATTSGTSLRSAWGISSWPSSWPGTRTSGTCCRNLSDSLADTSRIIDNVRRLQRTKPEVETNKVIDLCKVLRDLKTSYETAGPRDVTINVNAPPDCIVSANELVNDIFTNLIGNSIKHSSPEKPVIIDIRADQIKEKEIDYLRVTVEDNGPGIPNWLKDKIFMRFQRGDTKAHGKGLGLFIVRALVDDFGGKVWVEDRVPGNSGKGARFVVVLPAA